MIWLASTQLEPIFAMLRDIIKQSDLENNTRQRLAAEKLVKKLNADVKAGGTLSPSILEGLTLEGAYALVREHSRRERTVAIRHHDGTEQVVNEQARRSLREIDEDGKAGPWKQEKLWHYLTWAQYRRVAAIDIRKYAALGGVIARHVYVLDAGRRFPQALTPREAIILDGKDPDNLVFEDVAA